MRQKIRLLALLFVYSCAAKNPEPRREPTHSSQKQPETPQYNLEINPSPKYALIDAYFKDLFEKNKISASVLVAEHGKVIYKKSSGYANIPEKEELSIESSFQLASVSKQFTAAAIMLLKQRGSLNYSDKIQKFYPNFPYPDVTIKLLLTHRSGLPNYVYFSEQYSDRTTPLTNQGLVEMMIKNKPDAYNKPDVSFAYCNTNYALLAAIVEKVSHSAFDEFMKKEFFEPLAMNHSYINSLAAPHIPSNIKATIGHEANSKPLEPFYQDGIVGDKGAFSSVEDLYIWDRSLYDAKILSAETQEEAYQPASKEKRGNRNYGYGWRLRTLDENHKIVYHCGWWRGYNSLFIRLPYSQSTIIILANKRTNSFLGTYYKLLSILDPAVFTDRQRLLHDTTDLNTEI